MNTIIRRISLLLCVVATLASCHRKTIEDECMCEKTLMIPIVVDWTKSGITLQNVSVLFYDEVTDELLFEHVYEQNNKEIQSYAELPVGKYKAVIFNELRNEIDYVSCVGHEDFTTLKFESNDDTPLRSRTKVTTRGYAEQPGDLAVAVVKGIEVTNEMIMEASKASKAAENGETRALSEATKAAVESLMGVVTEKKNNTINITAHFNALNNARMPALVDLQNIADGYYVSTENNSTTSSTLQFTMNNRTYDNGSQRDGTISASLSVFGALGDRKSTSGHSNKPVMFDLLFKLIDKEQTEIEYKQDITDLMVFTDKSDGSVDIDVTLLFSEPLPDVVPEGSSGGSNFGSKVEDWGEIIPVPLD